MFGNKGGNSNNPLQRKATQGKKSAPQTKVSHPQISWVHLLPLSLTLGFQVQFWLNNNIFFSSQLAILVLVRHQRRQRQRARRLGRQSCKRCNRRTKLLFQLQTPPLNAPSRLSLHVEGTSAHFKRPLGCRQQEQVSTRSMTSAVLFRPTASLSTSSKERRPTTLTTFTPLHLIWVKLPKSSRSALFLSNAISRMLLQATDMLPKSATRLKSILKMRMKSQSMEQPIAQNRFRSPTKMAESSAKLKSLPSERKTLKLQPLQVNSRLSALQLISQPWKRCTALF